jgi:hypothetical protein
MNRKRFEIEFMRAILRSSLLSYDDAYPVVNSLSHSILNAVIRKEQEIEKLKKKQEVEELLKKQKRENNEL